MHFPFIEQFTETVPWLRAIHALHVGACFEDYGRIMRAVDELLEGQWSTHQ